MTTYNKNPQDRWSAAYEDRELRSERKRFVYRTAFHTYLRAMIGVAVGYFIANVGIFFYYWTGPKDPATLIVIQVVCCLLCAGPHLIKDLSFMSEWLKDFDHEHGFVPMPPQTGLSPRIKKAPKVKAKVMTGRFKQVIKSKENVSATRKVLKAKYVLNDDEMEI
ncbi:MAG: hypothetical protein P1V97_08270 [Planctomycetota bacterium]|nr:hypothetical protein [Planctomycetota bacterium]